MLVVKKNEPFPADLIILGSSFKNGNCYIETGALDGEKNLKPKCAITETAILIENFYFNNNDKSQADTQQFQSHDL